MAKRAFLFPGQGSQYVGMGKELCEMFPAARRAFEEASDLIGTDLARLCFDGPEEELRETRNTQPALFVKSWAVWQVVKDELSADFVAGHSLGEYSAIAVAGGLSFADGVRAVRRRGEAMWDSGLRRPGTMAAILGLDGDAVDALCRDASSAGLVQPANLNCPGQVVVSGEVAGVTRAVEIAPAHGAKKAVLLNVSGAFHSALMEDAQAELAEFLDGVTFHDTSIPVVANVTARPETEGAAIRRRLVEQMTAPVRWEETLRYLLEQGCTEFWEIGSGRVLKGLLRSVDRSAVCTSIGTGSSVAELLAAGKGAS